MEISQHMTDSELLVVALRPRTSYAKSFPTRRIDKYADGLEKT